MKDTETIVKNRGVPNEALRREGMSKGEVVNFGIDSIKGKVNVSVKLTEENAV